MIEINLRIMQEKDLETVLKWRNSERVRFNMFTDHIITMEEHLEWFNNINKSNKDVYLVFEYNRMPLGLSYFNKIDRINQTSFWGFYIGDDQPPRGCGTLMGFLSLNYAFFSLDLRKVYGEVFAFNSNAVYLFKKLGFKQEGYLKGHALKKDIYEDVIIFSIFVNEWLNKREELNIEGIGK